MRLFGKYHSDQKGGIIVEGALLLPLLILAGLGGLDASYLLLQNHRVESQLSMASSYLSKSGAPENRESQAKLLALTGTLDGTGKTVVPGWSSDDITINYIVTSNADETYRGTDDVRTVQVSTQFKFSGFGILSSVVPDGPQINVVVEERIIGGGL